MSNETLFEVAVELLHHGSSSYKVSGVENARSFARSIQKLYRDAAIKIKLVKES